MLPFEKAGRDRTPMDGIALPFEVREYELPNGRKPHADWLQALDASVRARITIALRRLEAGNVLNVKSVGEGVAELRLNFGPGFRIYFGRVGDSIILLLAGGSKHGQSRDISRAKTYWRNYQATAEE